MPLSWQRFWFQVKIEQNCQIPSFWLNPISIALINKLIRRPTATWPLCVFVVGLSVLPDLIGNWDIWFRKEREWSQQSYHGDNMLWNILFFFRRSLLVPSLYVSFLYFQRYSWLCHGDLSSHLKHWWHHQFDH